MPKIQLHMLKSYARCKVYDILGTLLEYIYIEILWQMQGTPKSLFFTQKQYPLF